MRSLKIVVFILIFSANLAVLAQVTPSSAMLKYSLDQINSGETYSTELETSTQPEKQLSARDTLASEIMKLVGQKEKKLLQKILTADDKYKFINVRSLQKNLKKLNIPAWINLYQGIRAIKLKGYNLRNVEEVKAALSQVQTLVKKFKDKPEKFGKFSFFEGIANEQLENIAVNPIEKKMLRASAINAYSNSFNSLKTSKTKAGKDTAQDAYERMKTLQESFGKIVPLTGKKGRKKKILITSDYGMRIHPVRKTKRFHAGIDLAGWKCKGWPVISIGPGRVVKSGWESGYGYLVVVSHEISGKQYFTRYAHLKKSGRVKNGTIVTKGKKIGYCNNSGISTGSHLHFEIREGAIKGKTIDPKQYIPQVQQVGKKVRKKK